MTDATTTEQASRTFTDATAESSWRYLYTRLAPRQFQDLCGAILVASGKVDVVCLPGDQADGGRDAVHGSTIYQFKWSKNQPKDPVQWLGATLNAERHKIEELVRTGKCDEYVLMTNVAGTARIGSGTVDRIGDMTRKMSQTLKIPVKCMWQHDLDKALDSAPDALKWSYVEMLAGIDLFRCLISAEDVTARDGRLEALISRVSAFQWNQDAVIKFEQVDLRKQRLAFLYVDSDAMTTSDERGSALLILTKTGQSTLIYGAPGQGKSTLAQALCQAHRIYYVNPDKVAANDILNQPVERPLLPLRVDVRNYANWLAGGDPFNPTAQTRSRARPATDSTVETYLAYQLRHQSGGLDTTSEDVHELLERFAALIVFDGLDEVGSDKRRSTVVEEIDAFMARHLTHGLGHQVVITTRPNAVGLAEPDHNVLHRLRLLPLDRDKQRRYLDRWSAARELDDIEHERLKALFDARTKHPHVEQLADNPMQLAILLYLIHTMGESVPSARTRLYEAYVDKLLVREGHKSKVVASKRQELIDVTSYLGWQVHSATESKSTNGRLQTDEIKRFIRFHLTETGAIKDANDKSVEVLFDSATQRVWALASKAEGTFEFDVQSIREYFAAKYLFEYAGSNSARGFDRGQVLRELLRRPYWLNVLRFYAGFLPPADLRGAVLSIEEEFAADRSPQARIGAWLLISDGALSQLPLAQERAVALFADDVYNRRVIYNAIFNDALLTALPNARGGKDFAAALMNALITGKRGVDPEDAQLLAAHLPVDSDDFDTWWHTMLATQQPTQPDLTNPASHPGARNVWAMGVPFTSGSAVPTSILDKIRVTAHSTVAVIESGVRSGSKALDRQLLTAVLAGWASDAQPAGHGDGPDMLRVLSPALLSQILTPESKSRIWPRPRHKTLSVTTEVRQAALERLVRGKPAYAGLVSIPGIKPPTPLAGHGYDSDPADGNRWTFAEARGVVTTLTALHGTSWLVAELAALALLTAETGHERDRSAIATSMATPLGIDTYLDQVRLHGHSAQWWTNRSKTSGPVDSALWCLGLCTWAKAPTINALIPRLNLVVAELDIDVTRALVATSSRLAVHVKRPGSARHAERVHLEHATGAARVMLGHRFGLPAETPLTDLADAGRFGLFAWPAYEPLIQRLKTTSGLRATMRAVGSYGPLLDIPPDVINKLVKTKGPWVNDVLSDPSAFPPAVVVAAGANRKALPDLGEVAERARWFDFSW